MEHLLSTSKAKVAVVVAVAAVITITYTFPNASSPTPISVAFIGNSVTYVNDLPRLMEVLSDGLVSQESCLHGGANLASTLIYGNGMLHKWQTAPAIIDTYGEEPVYDYGACSVPQLLFGVDDQLTEYNEGGYYTDDGKNPCLTDPLYLAYRNSKYAGKPSYDYIVMNDRTIYPAATALREVSNSAIAESYVDYIGTTQAVPVLLATWAYTLNTTAEYYFDFEDDIPEFTSRLKYGYDVYAQTLSSGLPANQQPLIAPVGLAFLLIYEEAFGLWKELFFYDGFHPSPRGTYLMGCVLFATMYGTMPSPPPEDSKQLFSRARRMQMKSGSFGKFPRMESLSYDDARYLWDVANRVVLQGVVPETLLTSDEVQELESQEGRR